MAYEGIIFTLNNALLIHHD